MENTQIIILAGGKGKRMNVEIPKVLVPFHGRPMIDYLIEASQHSGIITKPIIVVGYKKEDVMIHVGDKARYVTQEEQLGTGHAVRITEQTIDDSIEHILVLYGDAPAVTGTMIANLMAVHTISNCSLTMATVTVPSFNDWYQVFYKPFSRIVRDNGGNIVRSVEFKDANENEKEFKEINPCYFCFKKKWLFEHLAKLKNENAQNEYYLTDLVEYAAAEKSIASVSISPEEALGVNTIEELQRLEKIITR
ncbi:MAG: NTP transferase domain-containing protein [Patescibacteria group bacterium]|nr:NTP transferase domain-containing protein [Patescibacteria group bacterium]